MATSPSVSEVTMKRGLASPLGPLGLGDDAPLAAPALAGPPGKILELARRPAAVPALLSRRRQFDRNGVDQAFVSRQAEDVIDRMGFTPCHQGVTGKA